MNDRTINVLYIEDNPADAQLIREMMTEASQLGWDLPCFDMEHVDHLEAGLEHLEAATSGEGPKIDVVLTDLDLPDSQAENTFDTLRACFPYLPIVVLTGREDGELARRNVRAGAQDCIFKAEATGSLLAHALMYAIERQEAKRKLQKARDELETRVQERTESLRETNRELEAEIAERKRAEEERKRYIQELQLTNDAIVRVSRMQDIGRMCEFIGEKVHAVNQNAYVIVTLYDEELDAISIRSMMGFGEYIDRILDFLGWDPRGMTIQPDEMGEAAELYVTGRVEQVSLYELAAGKLSRTACAAIKRLLSIDAVYTVGFGLEDEPYGGVTILVRRGEEPRYGSAIETLASHVSVMIQRRGAESALRESERRLRHIVEGTQAMLVNVDERGRIAYVNEAAAATLEHPREDLIGELYLRFVHPEDRQQVNKVYREQIETEAPSSSLEFRIITGSGGVRWVNFVAHPAKEKGMTGLALDITERRRMEEALQESEIRFRSLFELSPDTVFLLDEEGVFKEVNTPRITGYSREDIIGRHFTEVPFISPESKRKGSQSFQERLAGGDVPPYVIEVETKGGEARYAEVNAARITKDDEVMGIMGVVRDVTERERAREALRESERRFRSLVENIVDWVWEVDENGAYTYVSPQAEVIMGYSPREMLGKTPFDFMSLEEAERIGAVFSRIVAKRERIVGLEDTLIAKDGREILFETNATPLFDADGEFMGYVGTCRDITARRRAEEEIRNLRDFYELILNNVHDGIWVTDEDERIIYFNPGMERVAGMTVEDAMGRSVTEDFAPETTQHFLKFYRKARRKGKPQLYEAEVVTPAGRPTVQSGWLVPRFEDGEYAGMICTIRDITARKRMEEALRESHGRLLTILDSIDADIYVADMETYEILFMNQHMRASFGEDLVGETCYDVFRGLSQPCPHCTNDQLLDSEGNPVGVVTWDGQNPVTGRWYINYDRAIRWVDGRLVRLQVATDITARKKAEQALRESEEHYRSLFEDSPISLWEEDFSAVKAYIDDLRASGVEDFRAYFEAHPESVRHCASLVRITDVNRATLEIFEAASQEEFRAGLDGIFIEETYPAFREELITIAQDQVWLKTETINQTLTGGRVYLSMHWRVVPGHEDTFSKVLVSFVDITERKLMEEALRESERQKELILNSTAEMVAYYDTDLRVIWSNRASGESVGKSPEELVGLHCYEIWNQRDEPCPGCPVLQAREDKAPRRGEQQTSDGRYWSVRGYPVLDEEGEVVALIEFGQDITERKRAEEKIEQYAAELERSNEELQQFAYAASHDLQAPLRTMRGYLDLLEQSYSDQLDDKAETYIGYIVDSAERMQEMISALLDLSRVETRGEEPTPIDVDAVLDRVLRVLGRTIRESGAEVVRGPLPTVMADQAQLAQVFQNLIANAIKFRREGEPPRVHISAERAGHEWVFSVEDNGIGINPKEAERIFQVFQRLHTEQEYPGLGMGLALCKRIVERHGGHIWVESEPGAGSTFRFTLPA